ncbi:hypothetical protein O1L60_32885 [Streptomyces diastatochromogenes]|nr:hypothetical protein [Streptomyces diastatochromogenes]
MKIRKALGTSAALMAVLLAAAPSASAGGNWDYGTSRLKLSNGYLFTTIAADWDYPTEQPGGGVYWKMDEWYEKNGGGTITAQFGFSYHGYSYNKGWFTQNVNTTSHEFFNGLGFNDCANVVGWLAVQDQGTFYNAPVTAC